MRIPENPFRLLFVLLLISTIPTIARAEGKMKIGLVLSGGGAKGLAHVGVIKVLEEAGIKVDIITGTSMGAIVGALYAAGYSPDEMKSIITSRDWSRLLLDRFSRRELRMNDKDSDGKYFMRFYIKKGKFTAPAGISRGQRITALFSRLTWPLHNITDFSRLPIPFACVATDLQRGQPVIINKGFLPMAMRATMSIPSFFTPVEYDGKLLVDGGAMENFPVTLAKKMGADIIIGVDVNDAPRTKEELKNIAEIITRITMFRNQTRLKKQRALCNILIRPNITLYKSSSFDSAAELLVLGEKAARKKIAALRKLAAKTGIRHRSSGHSVIYMAAKKTFRVAKITITGVDKNRAYQLRRIIDIEPGRRITAKELESRINTLYTSAIFQKITYRILPAETGKHIILAVKEGAEQQIRFGIRYDLDTRGQLLINHTIRNLIGHWSKLELSAELGRNLILAGELLFDASIIPWLQTGIKIQYEHWDINVYLDGKIDSTFEYDLAYISFALQTLNSRVAKLRLAISKEFAFITPNISNHFNEEQFHDFLIFSLTLNLDSTDRADFPTSGMTMFSQISLVTPFITFNPGELTKPVVRGIEDFRFYIPFSSRIVLFGSITWGFTDGETIPDDYLFYFGGRRFARGTLFPFPGVRFSEITARNVIATEGGIRLEPWRNIFISGFAGYLRRADSFNDLFDDPDCIIGWGGEIGIRTPVGPVRMAFMGSDINDAFLVHIEGGYRF